MRALTLIAFMALTGCAHSSLVLLPNEDGGHGEVAILNPAGNGGETLVKEVNSRALLGGSKPSIRSLGAAGLKPQEAALLASLPPAARSFTLYFHEGTTEITDKSAPLLAEIKAEVARRPGAEIQVTGHTDTVGSDVDNDVLSQRRAEEVLNVLANKGFARDMMSAVGRGERQLKVPTADNVSSPLNRRVEVIVR